MFVIISKRKLEELNSEIRSLKCLNESLNMQIADLQSYLSEYNSIMRDQKNIINGLMAGKPKAEKSKIEPVNTEIVK